MSANLTDTLATSIRKQMERELRPVDYFKASSIGHCIRKQVAVRAGIKPTHESDVSGLIKMWMGTELGKVVQAALEAERFLVPSWTERLVTYRSYRGHVDGLTRMVNPDRPYIVEIKTSDDRSVTKPDWPEHYLWQGMFYAKAAAMWGVLIFQLGRYQALSREAVFILNEKWTQLLEEHITEVEAAWEAYKASGVLPDCKHRFPWEDRMCPYREAKTKEVNPFEVTEDEKELAKWLDETHEEQDVKKKESA